jgi:acyl-CoA thioester hydrolase
MTSESPGNSHSALYRVRFDESTPAGLARTSALLRYAQDVAWAHSEALGFDRAWYAERSLAWLVRAAELEVLAPIPLGSSLDVFTSVVGHRRVWARRRGEFHLGEGGDRTLVAWVHTDWVLIDARGRITRVPEVFGATFPAPLSNDTLGRVALPAAPRSAAHARFRVRPQELDPMDHVNNAVYVDWLEESVLAAGADTGSNMRRPRHRAWSSKPRPGRRAGAGRIGLPQPARRCSGRGSSPDPAVAHPHHGPAGRWASRHPQLTAPHRRPGPSAHRGQDVHGSTGAPLQRTSNRRTNA